MRYAQSFWFTSTKKSQHPLSCNIFRMLFQRWILHHGLVQSYITLVIVLLVHLKLMNGGLLWWSSFLLHLLVFGVSMEQTIVQIRASSFPSWKMQCILFLPFIFYHLGQCHRNVQKNTMIVLFYELMALKKFSQMYSGRSTPILTWQFIFMISLPSLVHYNHGGAFHLST